MVQEIKTEVKKVQSWNELVETLHKKEFEEVSDKDLEDFFNQIKSIYDDVYDEMLYRAFKQKNKLGGKI